MREPRPRGPWGSISMSASFDVITIGDSTVDTFIKIHEATVECNINNKECRICIEYGGKIPVESIQHGVAGNAANVAVGCQALGLKCAIYTHLGTDWQAKMIKDAFNKVGVADDFIVSEENKDSNLSVVITYQGERSILVYHQAWEYRLPKLASTKWVYFTSVSESFSNSNLVDEVCHYVDKSRAKLAFGPGTYQLKADIRRYPKLLERCDFLILNRQEAEQTLAIDPKENVAVRDLLSKLLLLGPKIVVITDAAQGSYCSDGQRYLKAGIFPAKVVEKTGAGDAYSSAFLAALISGQMLEEAMVWGAVNSAHVITEAGAQNGLLAREALERHRKVVGELVATSL